MENTYLHQLKNQSINFYSEVELDRIPKSWIASSLEDAELVIFAEDKNIILNFDNKKFKINRKNLDFLIKNLTKHSSTTQKNFIKLNKKMIRENIALNLLSYFFHAENTETFFKNLLKNSVIDFANEIYVVYHKKGSSYAKSKKVRINTLDSDEISVENFNELFTTIKKSKQSSFAESPLKSTQISLAGTCLARTFTLRQHNLVIIATRNEFMPFSDQEIENFNSLMDLSLSFIEKLLDQEDKEYLHRSLIELSQFHQENKKPSEEIKEEFHSKRISLLGELLNTLRHELSNPLFGIQLSAQLLAEELKNSEDQELCHQIQFSIDKCLGIINEFSRMYDQKSGPQKINLKKFLEEIFTLTKSETKSIHREINFDLALEQLSEKEEVLINPTWLSQILFNLIINSAQALKTATIEKPLIKITGKLINSQIEISIKDNGPGIKETDLANIFDPFYTTKSAGTGLGLAISKNLALKTGGDLQCAKSDNGAHFILILPHEYPAG